MKKIFYALVALIVSNSAFAQFNSVAVFEADNYSNIIVMVNGFEINRIPAQRVVVERLAPGRNMVKIKVISRNGARWLKEGIVARPNEIARYLVDLNRRDVNLVLIGARSFNNFDYRQGMDRFNRRDYSDWDRRWNDCNDNRGRDDNHGRIYDNRGRDDNHGRNYDNRGNDDNHGRNYDNRGNDYDRNNNGGRGNGRGNNNVYNSNGYNAINMGQLMTSLNNTAFDNDRYNIATLAVSQGNITTAQVKEICSAFTFENKKLDFAKYGYSYTIDKENYFAVADVFTFASSKRELLDHIRRNG